MSNRVTIFVTTDGFSMEAKLSCDSEGNLNEGPQSAEAAEMLHVMQVYRVLENGSELVSGSDWNTQGLNKEIASACSQAAIAATKIARNYRDGFYSEVASITIDIGVGLVDCQIIDKDGESVVMHYSWDENAQMNAPAALSGDARKIDDQFLEDLREAAYGRFGLLSRCMANSGKVKAPIDDMGSLRWA